MFYMSSKIVFTEDGHRYGYKDKVIKNSVTTVIGKMSDPFDPEYTSLAWAYKKTLGDEVFIRLRREVFGYDFKPDREYLCPLFDGICEDMDEVIKVRNEATLEWSLAGPRGTAFHSEVEKGILDKGYSTNPWDKKDYKVFTFDKEFDNEVYDMDLYKLPDGVHTEVLVYFKVAEEDIENTIVGTIDVLYIETIDGVRYTDTDDHKTGVSEPESVRFNKKKKPLDHLWSNKIVDYSLQASMYQMAMASHGFTPRFSSFTFYENYDPTSGVFFPVMIMKDEVNKILEAVKNGEL